MVPGTDGALIFSMLQVMIRGFDAEFLARQTNAAYLVSSDDGHPITKAELTGTDSDADGRSTR